MKDVINEIGKIIDWWTVLPKDYNNIEYLLYTQQKLSGYSYNLASDLADFKRDYNVAYFWRKINVNKRKNAFIATKMSATAAESLAVEKCEEELRKELDAETTAFRAETLLKQISNILSSLTQRISYLKKEQERTRNENNLSSDH